MDEDTLADILFRQLPTPILELLFSFYQHECIGLMNGQDGEHHAMDAVDGVGVFA